MQIFGIILTTTDLWLFTICGVLAMAWIAYLFNDTLSKRNSLRTAAANFRTAIDSSCTIGLYNSFQVDGFRNAFISHKEAARVFRPYLSSFGKRRFDNAWNQYEEWANKILTESAHKQDGVYPLMLAHEGRDIKNELSEHIKNLLKFAGQV